MPDRRNSRWLDTNGHRDGEYVRLVTIDGLRFRQFKKNDREGKLIPFEAEEQTTADPRVPRTHSISQTHPRADRHGRGVPAVPAEDNTAATHDAFQPNYAYASDSRARQLRDLPAKTRPVGYPVETQDPLSRQGQPQGQHPPHQEESPRLAIAPNSDRPRATPARFHSSLSPLCHDFVDLPIGDYREFRDFVRHNLEIVTEECKRELLQDADLALKAGLNDYPESCVEKACLINECLELTEQGIREYLKDLTEDATRQREFEQSRKQTLTTIAQRAGIHLGTSKPNAQPPTISPTTSKRGYVSKYGQSLMMLSSHRDHGAPVTDVSALSSNLGVMTIENRDRHNSQSSAASRRNTTGNQPVVHQSSIASPHTGETNSLYPLRPSFSSPAGTNDGSLFGTTSLVERPRHSINQEPPRPSPNPEPGGDILVNAPPGLRAQLLTFPSANGVYNIKGTEGDQEELDHRYTKRGDARQFFKEGRVFALLWPENAGINDKPGKDVKFVTKGRYNTRIFTHIRRMVVVRQREGYCCCLGINSYGGQGIAKKGLKPSEQQAHAIIHMSTVKPSKHRSEPAMGKEPISVVMAPNQTLNSMSRLNYGQPNTVEWNVKVMNVGKVYEESLPFLLAAWRYEMFGIL